MTISRNNSIVYFHFVKSHTMLIDGARCILIQHLLHTYLIKDKLILNRSSVIFYFYKSLVEADNDVTIAVSI